MTTQPAPGDRPVPGSGAWSGSAAASTVASVTPDGLPRLVRLPERRLVAGVAVGVAEHLRVSVTLTRLVFVVLAVVAGAGVVAYALLWIFVPQASGVQTGAPLPASGVQTGAPLPAGGVAAVGTGMAGSDHRAASAGRGVSPGLRRPTAAERRRAVGIAAIGVAVGIVALVLGVGRFAGALAAPLVIVAIGAAFLWREADDAQRNRWRSAATGWVRPRRTAWWRVLGGVVLVVGGLAVFAVAQVDVVSARSAVVAVVLTLVGVAVIAVPWLAKLLRDLTDERRERIREAEKAEVAAHLHDSVLQTLALIQRAPGDAREVQRLARAQERDLRAWLYGPEGYAHPAGGPLASAGGAPALGEGAAPPTAGSSYAEPGTCAGALTRAAAQVEDTYAVTIEPVVVGDLPAGDEALALVAAAREAMVNAAKHSGVTSISVYAELERPIAAVYVRDRGCGFDPGAVPPDRRGVAESIRGRMERYGGRAEVTSTPATGTEWALTMTVP